jgi:hypothetical protein
VTNKRCQHHCHHHFRFHSPRKVLFNNEVKKASEKAELLNQKEEFILNALFLRIASPTKRALNDDTISPQNRFKTLKMPLKKHNLKNKEAIFIEKSSK